VRGNYHTSFNYNLENLFLNNYLVGEGRRQ